MRRPGAPVLLLWLLIAAYAVFFCALSLQQHASLNTYALDLSNFDQPMWNTVHGRFLERTLGDRQVLRTADHFEPILLPLSLVYLVWDDVRAILILQTLALALGALPVFWIARFVLGRAGHSSDRQAAWLALAFAAAYLLFPGLQAANLADFHADPFVVAPLLFATWYALQRRYLAMWLWGLTAMATKENLPTLTAMLGLWVAAPAALGVLRRRPDAGPEAASARRALRHGLALTAVSLAWFAINTYLIVAPAARAVYGSEGPVQMSNRYVAFGGSPTEIVQAIVAHVTEAPRLDYLVGLLAAVGWLALLAPEALVLGLPVLAANFFSGYAGQFSGEQHYTAPLAPAFLVAAVFGAQRLRSWLERIVPAAASRRGVALVAALIGAWLLAWSLSQQVQQGWTPLSRFYRWPEVTAHHRLLDRFAARIPADAALSTTPALHPHLAHRQKIYLFPIVADANYVLVDVPGETGKHPNDVHQALEDLLQDGGFGILDAADGYALLARKTAVPDPVSLGQSWPDAFYDFTRAREQAPAFPLDVGYGEGLRLAGYDVIDEPRWRQTQLRLYWQVTAALPGDLAIGVQVRTPTAALADDTALRPMPALVWRPPGRWQAGETVVTTGVPWYLPRAWAPVVTVTAGGAALAPDVQARQPAERGPTVASDGRLVLPGWQRVRSGGLAPFDAPAEPAEPADARFVDAGWTVRLASWSAPRAAAPGRDLVVGLQWQAAGAAPRDYTVFLHLRNSSGRTVATGDSQPAWFVLLPASRWPGGALWDAHAIPLPSDLPLGRYQLVAGWYDWETGRRLPLISASGSPAGDETVLGTVSADPAAAPRVDICCLYAQECCASLP